LAQTYPAAMHNSTTIPNDASTEGSGPMASKTRVSGEYDDNVVVVDAIGIDDDSDVLMLIVDKELSSVVVVVE